MPSDSDRAVRGRWDRRAFLGALVSGAASAGCGGGGGASTPGASTPAWAAFTDDIQDLLTGQPIPTGRILVPDRPAIDIHDGRYTVSDSHRLAAGATYGGVRLEAPGFVPRITGVLVERTGLRVDLGYARVPLDMIGDADLYSRWLQSRRARILERWDPPLYRGAMVFDRQLFRHDGMKPVLASTDFPVERSFVDAAVRVAGSEIAAMTGGALPDGVQLASQLPQSEWPSSVGPNGWLIYDTLDNYFERQTFSILSAPFSDGFGSIGGAFVALPPGRPTDPDEILEKTREAMCAFGPGSVPSQPVSVGRDFGTIQYNRKVGQVARDVPDHQD